MLEKTGNEKLTITDPLVAVSEVIAQGGLNVLVRLQRLQNPHSGVVHVVTGVLTGRISPGDYMGSNRCRGHLGLPKLCFRV